MTAKFRVGFTITGETLMNLAAKAFHSELEIEQLSIEELPTVPSRLNTKINAVPHRRKGPPPTGPKLDAGINRIILDILSDGEPHRATEMKKPFKAQGYAENSVGSRLYKLQNYGLVERVGDGTWRLTNREARPSSN